MSNTQVHGGDLDIISRKYSIPKEEIVNYSGNVNPLGLPETVKAAIAENLEAICDYPDVSYLKLRPVSYTHLDVYKRQFVDRSKSNI